MTERIAIAYLREHFPMFKWNSVRSGMGWRYRGTHRQTYKWVEIYACAESTGEPYDDNYRTSWWAKHQGRTGATERYEMWAMRYR